MSGTTPPSPLRVQEPTRKRWPSASQALVLVGGGLLLGIGGCSAFLATMGRKTAPLIGAAIFFAGLALLLVGLLEVTILIFRALLKKG